MGAPKERDGRLSVSIKDQDTWDMIWFMEHHGRRRKRSRGRKTP
jgi:thiamine phosphate synthase YjbQ (UPF0047 family)